MYTEYMYNDSLCHYGTKGMKWGVRKYQYEDGRYTPEGESRRLAKIHGGIYRSNGEGNTFRHKIKSKYHQTKTNLKHLSKDQKKALRRKLVSEVGKKAAVAGGLAAAGLGAKYLYGRGGYKLVGKAMQKASPQMQKVIANSPNLIRAAKRVTRKPRRIIAGGLAAYGMGKEMDKIINQNDTSYAHKKRRSKGKKAVKRNASKKVSSIKNKR